MAPSENEFDTLDLEGRDRSRFLRRPHSGSSNHGLLDSKAGVFNLLVSLGHTGRRRVVLGHTLNTPTLRKTDEQKKKVLSKFKTFCWATFLVILGCMRPAGWTLRHSHKLTQAPCLIRQKREEIIVGSETAPVVTGNWISVQQPQYLSLAKKKIRAKNQTIRESLLGKSQR